MLIPVGTASDKTTPGFYDAPQTAFLLLDFHTAFIEKATSPEVRKALQVAANLRSWAKTQGIQVIHCTVNVNDTPSPTCKDGQRLLGTIAAMKTSGGEEASELLEDFDGDVTFMRKPGHVSALKSPGLEEYLQKRGICSLLLAGLSTSGCVMRTAFAACDAEYVVSVVSDGCADPVEGMHDILVKEVLNKRGYVVTAAEILGNDSRM